MAMLKSRPFLIKGEAAMERTSRFPLTMTLVGALLVVAAALPPARGAVATRRLESAARHSSEARTTRLAAQHMGRAPRLPLAFEKNAGQIDDGVRYLARGRGYTLSLSGGEAVLRLVGPRPEGRVWHNTKSRERAAASERPLRPTANMGAPPGGKARQRACTTHGYCSRLQAASPMGQTRRLRRGAERRAATPAASSGASLRLRLLGANPTARLAGEAPLPGKSNYLIGNNPRKWRTNVPQYASVRHEQAYPGIDVVYYGDEQGRLEYDFELAPGADPDRIRLAFAGASRVKLGPNGDLLLHTQAGTLRQHRPVAYQLVNGERKYVSARYRLQRLPSPNRKSKIENRKSVALQLGDHDPTLPLVIDPVLSFSGYLGGTGFDEASRVTSDTNGNVYVTGRTGSADFPGADPADRGGGQDCFVAKYAASGNLVYATYIGGSGTENGWAIGGLAADADGNAYVSGTTGSANFPVTAGAFDTTHNGGQDAFVAKLSPEGAALLYSTYLGGANQDGAFDFGSRLAVDGGGNAFVSGVTFSNNFPTTAGAFDTTYNGNGDAYVAALNAAGSGLLYATYVGGGGRDIAADVAVDSLGSAYIVGDTNSPDLPTVNPLQGPGGGFDGFVTKLAPDGTGLVYSTYLGGSGNDETDGIAVDAAGSARVVGYTESNNFPTLGAIQPARAGGIDAYVSRLHASGAALVFSTYLGGGDSEFGIGVTLGSGGEVYVAGRTRSANFPTVDPLQPAIGGGEDAFVTAIDAAGAALLYSTYLGGGQDDSALGIAAGRGAADLYTLYVTGVTASPNFPRTPGQPGAAGGGEAFLTLVTNVPPPPPAAPDGLTAEATGSRRVVLTWADNSDDEAGFWIERRTGGGPFTRLPALPAGTAAFTDLTAVPHTTHTYRVLSFNAGGESTPSNQAVVTTLAAPSNLAAQPLSQTEVRLTWSDNSLAEEGFEVWRSAGAGFVLVGGTGPDETLFPDQNLQAAATYFYQVRAVAADSDSDFSGQVAATTLPNPPAPPGGLTATASSTSTINLRWTDNSGNETQFLIERSLDGGVTFTPLDSVPANVTTYVHQGLAAETTYHYRVKARNTGGDSATSNVAFATTFPTPPDAPGHLVAAAQSASEVRLTWADRSQNEQGFRIERRTGNGPFVLAAEVGPGETEHIDGGLASDTMYSYRIRSFNLAGASDWSNVASARTLPVPPAAPTGLTALAAPGQVLLAWIDMSSNERGFLVERSGDAGAHWSQVASLPVNTIHWADSGITAGRTFHYRLKAWNLVGESPYSNTASATTEATVVGLTALTVKPSGVRGGRDAAGTVTVSGPAPVGGMVVALASSHAAASVPATVTVAGGETSARFTISTARVRRTVAATLRATLAGVERTATLQVRAR